MMKLRSKRFCTASTFRLPSFVTRCNKKIKVADDHHNDIVPLSEIKWELRPGGMLVQRREIPAPPTFTRDQTITVRVSTVSQSHDISIQPISTFGKERDDCEYLHMVGVGDKDKVLLLEDPAITERKLHGLAASQPISV
ncbi:BAG family molecular chaperone regulator 2, partial [Cucurbita argyrosperma subsp. argyrosperma]